MRQLYAHLVVLTPRQPVKTRPHCSLTMVLACLQVQNIYVPIVLSVLFGVMVILGLAATVLLLLRRLRSGGTFLALLWFWTVIYMIAGPGWRCSHGVLCQY